MLWLESNQACVAVCMGRTLVVEEDVATLQVVLQSFISQKRDGSGKRTGWVRFFVLELAECYSSLKFSFLPAYLMSICQLSFRKALLLNHQIHQQKHCRQMYLELPLKTDGRSGWFQFSNSQNVLHLHFMNCICFRHISRCWSHCL